MVSFEGVFPLVEIFEEDAGAASYAGERVVDDLHGEAGGIGQNAVEAAQECIAADECENAMTQYQSA